MKEPTIKDLSDKLDLLMLATIGDEPLGIKGHVQRLEETQTQVAGHDKRITKLEDENKKFKLASFVKGVGVGAGSAGSAFALGSTKAGAVVVKFITALGAVIFVCYLVMIVI
jgi:hypothetical protein